MKILMLLVSTAALAAAADSPSLTGKWQVHNSIQGNESDQACEFTQKDNDLSGTCTSDRGTVTIAGKVDGDKVNWSFKSEHDGTPLTVVYEGKVNENKITGTVNVPEFSADGEFTATAAK